MGWKPAGAMTVLLTLAGVGTVGAQPAEVVVRTFDNYGIPAGDLREARAYASAILNAAGINVTWLDCWQGGKAPADAPVRCSQPVGSDLVLRLQRAPAANRERFASLGFALVTPDALPFLATVFADLAEGVARRAGVSSRPVLGRAIAHEIGHLLLNENTHSKDGLMRAAWSQAELRKNSGAVWQFQDEEAETMRAAARLRHVSPPQRHDPTGLMAKN